MSRQPGLYLIAVIALAACSAPSGAPATAPSSATPTAESSLAATAAVAVATATVAPTAVEPIRFTSGLYGYSVTLPGDWNTGAAMLRWDGASAPGHDDGSVDKLVGPGTAMVFVYAAPVTGNLDGFVKENIAWTVRDHGDTCPASKPDTIEPIEIGGEPGKLLSWNCGILINPALMTRDGTGFVFVMRDTAVPAATDPADRALFEQLLDSVTFAR